MADPWLRLSRHPRLVRLLRGIGIPTPGELARGQGGYEEFPLQGRSVAIAAAPGGYLEGAAGLVLRSLGGPEWMRLDGMPNSDTAIEALIYDASGCLTPASLKALYADIGPTIRRLAPNARILLLARPLTNACDAVASATTRGVEGFVRALAKEVGRRGVSVNLAYVEPDAADRLDMLVRFFCTARASYVTGQSVLVLARVTAPEKLPAREMLKGKLALVTGAARGIGAATAFRLAEEGAHVVCLDVPSTGATLTALAGDVSGSALHLDLTQAEAPKTLKDWIYERFGGVEVVVHNAGVTRDKTLANMSEAQWDQVIAVNLQAVISVDDMLLSTGLLRRNGRVVCLSSISGIAGNFGQTNYATSKAALIGYVQARSRELCADGITINAVAPGFIETPMTESMPMLTRMAGRRLNSLGQGGLPADVAELVTFLATPGAHGVSGNTLRVCGQALLGA